MNSFVLVIHWITGILNNWALRYTPVAYLSQHFTQTHLNTPWGNCYNNVERKCSQCPEDTSERSTKIQNEPEIMSFQFQRFSFDNLSNKTVKIDHPIKIPMTLSLPYLDEPVYNLASAIVHSGTPSTGHYIALVRWQYQVASFRWTIRRFQLYMMRALSF